MPLRGGSRGEREGAVSAETATIRRLRATIREMLPHDHIGNSSDDAPCNETCRTRNGRLFLTSSQGSDTPHRHRPDIQGRTRVVLADKCDQAPDLRHPSDVCVRCIGLAALKRVGTWKARGVPVRRVR